MGLVDLLMGSIGWAASLVGGQEYKKEKPKLEPPIFHRPYNPFQDVKTETQLKLIEESLKKPAVTALVGDSSKTSPISTLAVNNDASGRSSSEVKDVKASDYITPQKYLDGAQIPTFFSFQMNMIAADDLKHGMQPTLEVDKRLTIPTRTHIRFLVTATDVLHSFALPSLNIKVDAIPGRICRHNTFILREGVFYGQCAEMCGALHGFMPIVVEAVAPETYAAHARKYYKD